MKQNYFITGTDTEIGKTWCAATLMHYFRREGLSVIGMKPISSGCQWSNGQLRNEDALILQAQASLPMAYEQINPYAFEPAISPHIASKLAGINIDIDIINDQVKTLVQQSDVLIVEAVGGWLTPLNSQQDVSDLARTLDFPVILIVGIRLGCINHAKLSHRAIVAKGLLCAGWIANCIEPDLLFIEESIRSIAEDIVAPLLGILPFSSVPDFSTLSKHISF